MNEAIVTSLSGLIAIATVALVALRGWQGWLTLKQRELETGCHPAANEIERGPFAEGSMNGAFGGARIEIADLKERIRKLEAIASGVDL